MNEKERLTSNGCGLIDLEAPIPTSANKERGILARRFSLLDDADSLDLSDFPTDGRMVFLLFR